MLGFRKELFMKFFLQTALSGVVAIAAGGAHSLAVTSAGAAWAWGDDNYGQLGDSSSVSDSSIM